VYVVSIVVFTTLMISKKVFFPIYIDEHNGDFNIESDADKKSTTRSQASPRERTEDFDIYRTCMSSPLRTAFPY
jgi:hypothetical protein